MTYYAYKQSIKDGVMTATNKTGEKAAMEYQYYLFCANCAQNNDANAFAAVEWGTVEGGKLERKAWNYEAEA